MKLAGALVACAAALLHGADQEHRFYVTSAAAALIDRGLTAPAPSGAEAAAFQKVPAPGIRFRPSQAQATLAPWVESNGWRFRRGLTKANYAGLPAGSAPLAAAEAFAFDVEAIVNPDAADVADLERMLRFLEARRAPALPVLANVAVVDDRSPEMGEVLNMLTRRNLLYRWTCSSDARRPPAQADRLALES